MGTVFSLDMLDDDSGKVVVENLFWSTCLTVSVNVNSFMNKSVEIVKSVTNGVQGVVYVWGNKILRAERIELFKINF